MAKITRERAERIARAHACEECGEYSYKTLTVKPALPDQRAALGVAWRATKVCGVCGVQEELGISDEGEILYAG